MVGWWIELHGIDCYVRGVYGFGDLCCVGWRDVVNKYIYRGLTILNLFRSLCCFIGIHDWIEEKDTVVKVACFTIRHYKCKRCIAIKCKGEIE